MKSNKSLGSSAVLSLSQPADVVRRRDFRRTTIEVLAWIGWAWMVWYLLTQGVQLP
jgi:hypothetical protein